MLRYLKKNEDYTYEAIIRNEFNVDIIDIYPLETPDVPKYLDHIKMVGKIKILILDF